MMDLPLGLAKELIPPGVATGILARVGNRAFA